MSSLNRNFDVVEAKSFTITTRRRPTLTHRPLDGHGLLKNWFWHLANERRMAA